MAGRVAPVVFFPNWVWRIKLRPVAPREGAGSAVDESAKYKDGGTFKTRWVSVETRNQQIGKVEMRALLEKVYGLEVAQIRSLNVMGKRKRVVVTQLKKTFEKKMPDLKRFYVLLKADAEIPWSPDGVPALRKRLNQQTSS